MSNPKSAVFLSYSSDDAEAALRICEALRTHGIEVWFDQSELRGGDEWDAAIRRQIKACALFVPIISAHTHARVEAYFRLEWKLAVDRSYLMAHNMPFLLPIVIDDTHESDDRVPDRFRDMQWTRAPNGVLPPGFAEHVVRLLSPQADRPATGQPFFGNERPRVVPPAAAPAATSKSARRNALWGMVLLLGLALGYVALDRLVLSQRGASALQSSASSSPISEKSIAVLPFVNLSSDKEQEYFSDGLAEELLDLLAKTPGLHVIARTSSFSFKGKSEDIPTIAKKLKVANILEGSVRKAGNRLRVTTQLVRADNGEHIWSETYDRELNDVFKVQDEIAGAVVAALKLKLSPTQISARSTSNNDAYNQYLLGRQFHNRTNPDGWHRAIDAFHKAIALDPGYAAAYAGLALSEIYVADETGDPQGYKRALEAADKAVELSPGESEGYRVRGTLRTTYTSDWVGAEADLAKAIALDPGDSRVHRAYSQLLADFGRLPEAIAEAKQSTELDPLSSPAWQNLAQYLIAHGDYAAAHEANRRALEINPESGFAQQDLGVLQLLEGNASAALATFRKIGFDGFRLPGISRAEYTLGHAKESQQALDDLIAAHAQEGAYQIAQVYAWRGEKDKAFEWLERAYQQHDPGLTVLGVDPQFASLRRDPRFNAMLRKMNLPER